ncbi:MAG: mechanosensitive ion channel domain-containing protein [Pseudomonadota bacterium]
MSWIKALAIILVLAIVQTGPVFAQEASEEAESVPTLPAELTRPAIRDAISKMDDAAVRQMLIERLDAVVAAEEAQQNQPSLIAFVGSLAQGVAQNVVVSVIRVPTLADGIWRAFSAFFGPKGLTGSLQFFAYLAIAIGAGYVAGYLSDRLVFSRWRNSVETAKPDNLVQTLQVLGLRFALDIASLIVFAITAHIALSVLMPSEKDLATAWSGIANLMILVLATAAVTRFLGAPSRPDLRLISATDETTRFFHRHMKIIAFIVGLINFLIFFFVDNGIKLGELKLAFWVNLLLYAWIIQMVWRARQGITDILIGGEADPSPGQLRLARAWPIVTLVLVVLNWLLIEVLVAAERYDLLRGQQNVTLAFILFAPAFDTMIRGLVRHIAPPMQGEGPLAEQAHRRTKESYIRIGRGLMLAAGVVILANMWGLDVETLRTDGFGAQIAAGLVEIILILAAGYILWEGVTLWVNRKLADEMTAAGHDPHADEGGEIGGAGGSRLSTVLPLLLRVGQVSIIVITVLLGLAQIGINITPLLAGAGIVGLAIGFGAQTLVRDVVSGIFFLFDDAFRIGEYIEVGETRGTVEKISVRSIQLRHHRGAVHTVPYGEIPKVTNQSRDWAIMKLRFTVPFGTDTEKVRKLFKKIGQEMLEDEELGDDFLQPFKSQGVLEFDDVGIVLRGKFMAKPGKQFTLRKEIFKRVQQAFEENGIEFARKEVRVRVPDQEDGEPIPPAEMRKLAAAAAEAETPPPAAAS